MAGRDGDKLLAQNRGKPAVESTGTGHREQPRQHSAVIGQVQPQTQDRSDLGAAQPHIAADFHAAASASRTASRSFPDARSVITINPTNRTATTITNPL